MLPRVIRFTEMEEAGQIGTSASTPPDSQGRLLALDFGARRIGVAVSDELRITARPLAMIERRSWKQLLRQVTALVASFDARGLVIGLPLYMDGNESEASREVRDVAEKLGRSLAIPIYLQDERLTTLVATAELKSAVRREDEIEQKVDSEAAAIILRDFITRKQS
jgi:putative holliday junction resolvase